MMRSAILSGCASRIAQVGCILLALLPLAMVFSRTAMELLGIAICLLFLLHSLASKDWRWVQQTPILILLALWVYSIPHSPEHAKWVRFILLFAAVVYWLSAYRAEMQKVLLLWFGVVLLVALDALVQYISGMSVSGHASLVAGAPLPVARLTGPFEKPVVGIFLAKLSIGVVGGTFLLAWKAQDKRAMLCVTILFSLIAMIVLLSNERTATISVFLCLALAYGAIFLRCRSLRLWVAGLVLLQATAVGMVLLSSDALQNVLSNSQHMIQNFGNSPYGQLWQASILMWREHVLMGVGIHQFREICPELIERGLIHYCNLHPHNFYLEWLSELGIVGFWGVVLFISSLVVMVSRMRISNKEDRYFLRLIALLALVVNFFPFVATQSAFSNWPAMLMWLSLALPFALLKGESRA